MKMKAVHACLRVSMRPHENHNTWWESGQLASLTAFIFPSPSKRNEIKWWNKGQIENQLYGVWIGGARHKRSYKDVGLRRCSALVSSRGWTEGQTAKPMLVRPPSKFSLVALQQKSDKNIKRTLMLCYE